MPSPSDLPLPEAERCLARLADCLQERRETITRIWIEGVRLHPGIPNARGLTFQELSDHLPRLFDDMAKALRAASRHERLPDQVIIDDAQQHGLHRWQQDFRLDELLRELSLIRSLVLREGINTFLKLNPGCEPQIEAARDVINRFFEETNVASVEQYIGQQQAQLETLNRELSQIDATRLRLIGTVAHELGNSVYSLRMIIQALSASEGHDPGERARALGLSEVAFGEIQTFLNQLTDYAALLAQPVVDWENVDLHAFGQEIDATFRPAATAAGMQFAVRIDPALGQVRSERPKLKRIIANLVTNAIKFRRPDRTDGEVTLAAEPDGEGAWVLAVQDNGIGIAPADRERVFEEFARLPTRDETPGAGLGLSITKRLVELMGGRIAAEGGAGGGSRFVVRLPLGPREDPRQG